MYFRVLRMEKEDWAWTEMTAEEASRWEMSWETVTDTQVILENPMDQQVAWMLRGDIITTRVSVKKTAG